MWFATLTALLIGASPHPLDRQAPSFTLLYGHHREGALDPCG